MTNDEASQTGMAGTLHDAGAFAEWLEFREASGVRRVHRPACPHGMQTNQRQLSRA
jgi:hypothetical protein